MQLGNFEDGFVTGVFSRGFNDQLEKAHENRAWNQSNSVSRQIWNDTLGKVAEGWSSLPVAGKILLGLPALGAALGGAPLLAVGLGAPVLGMNLISFIDNPNVKTGLEFFTSVGGGIPGRAGTIITGAGTASDVVDAYNEAY